MSKLELNALSVVLNGSFTARVFLPAMDKLALDDNAHEVRYPVLWLLHTDGETSLEFMKTPIDALAEKYGIIVIAPDMHHWMSTDCAWGPNMEKFLTKELRGIFRHVLPISDKKEQNYIGGVGTGAYGVIKCAAKHPELYAKAFCLNGIMDIDRVIEKTIAGKDTGIPQTEEAFKALFGNDLSGFKGSRNDAMMLASEVTIPVYLSCEADFAYASDTRAVAELLGNNASVSELPAGADFDSYQVSMRRALQWLVG